MEAQEALVELGGARAQERALTQPARGVVGERDGGGVDVDPCPVLDGAPRGGEERVRLPRAPRGDVARSGTSPVARLDAPRIEPVTRLDAESGRRESNPRSQLGNRVERLSADVTEHETAGQSVLRTVANKHK